MPGEVLVLLYIILRKHNLNDSLWNRNFSVKNDTPTEMYRVFAVLAVGFALGSLCRVLRMIEDQK